MEFKVLITTRVNTSSVHTVIAEFDTQEAANIATDKVNQKPDGYATQSALELYNRTQR